MLSFCFNGEMHPICSNSGTSSSSAIFWYLKPSSRLSRILRELVKRSNAASGIPASSNARETLALFVSNAFSHAAMIPGSTTLRLREVMCVKRSKADAFEPWLSFFVSKSIRVSYPPTSRESISTLFSQSPEIQ